MSWAARGDVGLAQAQSNYGDSVRSGMVGVPPGARRRHPHTLERVMDFSEGPNLKKPLFRRTWRLLADDARPECVG